MGTDSTERQPVRMSMPADDALRAWIAAAAGGEAVASRLGAARLRLASKALARDSPTGPEMAAVEHHDLGNHLSVRVYRPQLARLPVVVYAHGGGYCLGDLDTHDRLARRLAWHADVTVASVDYRRAPEYVAPAAVDDVIRTAFWAQAMLGLLGGDEAAGVGLAGDSAGGLLAAAAAVRLRDAAAPGHLLLLTPQTDLTLTHPSVTEKGHGYGLELADLVWYVDQWVPERHARFDPTLSPYYAAMVGLPPTFVVTAEHDPLRDDGLSIAARLRGSGGVCEHLHFEHLVHGFLQLDHVSAACRAAGDEALRRYGDFLRRVLPLQPTS